jgi:uncharacterized heparinase superfamily protein
MNLHLAPVDSWFRVLRTTRHLHISQIAHRVNRIAKTRIATKRVRLPSQSHAARPDHASTESILAVPEFARGCSSGKVLLEELQQGSLSLVNRSLPLVVESPDWRLGNPTKDRLWTITLHYHAWLYELSKLSGCDTVRQPSEAVVSGPNGTSSEDLRAGDETFRLFLRNWLDNCQLGQPGVESLAWNSYAIATRLGWWARTWHRLGSGYWEQHADLARDMLQSMYGQARHLAANLEWDLRANHLLRDAVGLAWAGRFFEGSEADRWLEKATQIVVAQAGEQMLDDGGHFERSPFYHLEVMDDWLTLVVLLSDESHCERLGTSLRPYIRTPGTSALPLTSKLLAVWEQAAEYTRWLTHPDGRTVQFNDGAAAIVAPHLSSEWISRLGARLGSSANSPLKPGTEASAKTADVSETTPHGGRYFKDSGVVAWHGEPWTLFWDVGEIGPDCQPGHAHADTLSFEASYEGQRLFVDPGCHSYDNDQRRKYDRSTAAHNTVCIDEQNSSEVWHIFRVGRRARPREVSVAFTSGGFEGQASHSGYDQLAGRPAHQRQIAVRGRNELHIVDTLTGKGHHTAEGGLLVDPVWTVEEQIDGWLLTCDQSCVRVRIEADQSIALSTETCPIHPDYGVEVMAKRLKWRFDGTFPLQVAVQMSGDKS